MENGVSGVSIIIPHYKTEILVKLCLRSIRYYTKQPTCEVIVVDNGSGEDPSLDYLRNVKWIKLIEHDPGNVSPSDAHKQAMDIGIANSSYPYVLSFHTDSIPIRTNWLLYLISRISSGNLAAIGSYKLELKSPLQLLLKRLEGMVKKSSQAGTLENPYYIRSHCALYRRDLLEEHSLRFACPGRAGMNIHFGLLDAGYRVEILPARELLRYLVHLNHGTMALRPELGARKKTIRKGKSRIEKFLNRSKIREIYEDSSLDS